MVLAGFVWLFPLYLWERVEFLNERSEFRNSGEGSICKLGFLPNITTIVTPACEPESITV